MTVAVKSPWQYKLIDSFTKGVNTVERADGIAEDELLEASNVYFFKRTVKSDTGFKTRGAAVDGTPRAIYQFFKTTGTSELLLFTNTTAYRWLSSQWQYLHDGTSTTLSANASAGATSVDVTSTAGLSVGNKIGIILDDASEFQTTIDSIAGSTINFPAGQTLPSAATAGNAFVKAATLNGSDDEQLSFVTMPAFNWLVFTNGVDVVKYYDGAKIANLPGLPSGGNTICQALALIDNYLILLNTKEGGTAYPQRVRWSDTGDPTNWSSGNASYVDLYNSEDFIVTSLPFGPYIMIYRERSIVRMEYVGSSTKLFNFDTLVEGEGVRSVDSVVDAGGYHVFVGNSDIYKFQGSFDITPLSRKITNKLFGTAGEINPSYSSRSMLLYIEELDEIWLFYADANGKYPNKLARYSIQDDGWAFRDFGIPITGYGFYQRDSTQTWAELVGSWAAQTWRWGDASLLANSPITNLLTNDATIGNRALDYDYTTTDDNGNPIAWSFTTKDFFNPTNKIRSSFIEFAASGSSVTIEYSTDAGLTWNKFGSATGIVMLSTDINIYRVYQQLVTKRIRFRFSGTVSGFTFEWFGFRFREEAIQ